MSFKDTRLWNDAFSQGTENLFAQEKSYFSNLLDQMRERAIPIVARILRDMPNYTVHDITHLDALWETASLIAGDKTTLNPPEAFVFGGAILIHDAAMTLAAYPNGIQSLKDTTEWNDIKSLGKLANGKTLNDTDVLTEVLRTMHAKKAESLATQAWPIKDIQGNTIDKEFLIESSEIRRFYGPTIGAVAGSHWWPISKVERELDRYLGPMPPYTKNEVDILKLACLIRVADATHLDRRRAPPFVRALDTPAGISSLHWEFQGRLAFPRLDGDSIQYTAGEPCPVEQASAWWLGYDAFQLADRELKDTDLLLRERGREPLRARRVRGAESPSEMSRYIPVQNWKPVETKIHTSDITRIIDTLGGQKLYGEDTRAPIRELIQNASDAIQARRRLQNISMPGNIRVSLFQVDGDTWLSVEDNGVGMSERVITNNLLDFGSSFWRSPAVTAEFPSLLARGMESIGQFGIGFFSVFMLGERIRLTTKRFDKSYSDALELNFFSGLKSRPILSSPLIDNLPPDGGTRVEIKLWSNPRSEKYFELSLREPKPKSRFALFDIDRAGARSLDALIEQIAPAIGENVSVVADGETTSTIEANDWRWIDAPTMGRRVAHDTFSSKGDLIEIGKHLREITDPLGANYGRAALWPTRSKMSVSGVLTSGGFKIQRLPHFFGIIKGSVSTASRNSGFSDVPYEAMRNWSTEQGRLMSRSKLSSEMKALSAELILRFGGSIGGLPLIRRGDQWYNTREFKRILGETRELAMYVGDVSHSEEDEVGERTFDVSFEENPEVFFVPVLWESMEFKNIEPRNYLDGHKSELLRVLGGMIEKAWHSSSRQQLDDFTVGEVDGTDILREVYYYNQK